MSKRYNGEGSFTKLPNGSWRGQIALGRKEEGALQRPSCCLAKSQDVKAWAKIVAAVHEQKTLSHAPVASLLDFISAQAPSHEVREAVLRTAKKCGLLLPDDESVVQEPQKHVFVEYLLNFVELYKSPPSKKETTYSSYLEKIVTHVKPYFADTYLEDLDTDSIQTFYNYLLTRGRKDGKAGGLSPKTLHNIHIILNPCFERAVEDGLIPKNPALKTERPQIITPEMRVLSRDEMDIFLREVQKERQSVVILTKLFTGLRLGELLPLGIDDLLVSRKSLRINKNYTRVQVFDESSEKKTKMVLQKSAKTHKSNREVPLSDDLFLLLQAHIQRMESNKTYNPKGLLFPTRTGTIIDPRTFQRTLGNFSKRCNIQHVNPHALRHSFATRLSENKESLAAIQELLGHNSIQTTRRYIHAMEQEKRSAVNALAMSFTVPPIMPNSSGSVAAH